MTEGKKYLARVKGLAFIEAEEASWIAIDSLLYAEGRGADFDQLFVGIMADRFFVWLRENADTLSEAKKAEAFDCIIDMELPRAYAAAFIDANEDIFREDLAPLGRAISHMYRDGVSKREAFEEQADHGNSIRKYNDPENLKKWPTPLSGISIRSLERRWEKYQHVLPFVMVRSLKIWADQNGAAPPLAESIMPFGNYLRARLTESATRRPLALPEWRVLEFV